ncbi:phospholipid/cholesterol/gamma-HCH transport system permease protein [Faunimonas pinastri]|uniref:Phospholipid/cholesterol/gamma-HCH transport system permease protein n=1 Tax=Faunimonas pinastri TaxID=1855383 RepID=A0A1H9FBT7_9HYPH|nr:ABC transporter permease [Faunimonas pinastri]SEQ35411.1 phospholipid/cholesterol/gamma-HCH transport system permease protein [Faunimonas pinastri]
MTAALDVQTDGNRFVLRPKGSWVIAEAAQLDRAVRSSSAPDQQGGKDLLIDVGSVDALDTSGAFLLARVERQWSDAGRKVEWSGADHARTVLLDRVRAVVGEDAEPFRKRSSPNILSAIGDAVLSTVDYAGYLLRIFGALVLQVGYTIRHPSNLRFTSILHQMDSAGVRAMPIVLLLSLIVGGIIAQQGAFQLQYFGASIFAVDLVGILALRELAMIITAIMVAGRSGSAITAELGSMRMREETDALQAMGLDAMSVLVLPRVISLVIVLPLLTFMAAMASIAGAIFTLWLYAGISPTAFIGRFKDAVTLSTLAAGLLKAPFMAIIIAIIACAEGMLVQGSSESLGRHTTASVVKGIFMVIVVDGLFAIFYAAINF